MKDKFTTELTDEEEVRYKKAWEGSAQSPDTLSAGQIPRHRLEELYDYRGFWKENGESLAINDAIEKKYNKPRNIYFGKSSKYFNNSTCVGNDNVLDVKL
jgi:hypothetical protein